MPMIPRMLAMPAACALVALAAPPAPASAQPSDRLDPAKVAQLEAGYVHYLADATGWPEAALAAEADAFAACILGEDPHGVADVFQAALDSAGLEAQGRPMALHRLRYASREDGAGAPRAREAFEEALASCRLLFVLRSEAQHWSDVRALLGERPVVTLGEFPGFARAGGILEFWIDAEQRELEYRVNLASAERAGLRLPPEFLRIEQVRIVEDDRRRSGRRERIRAGYGRGER